MAHKRELREDFSIRIPEVFLSIKYSSTAFRVASEQKSFSDNCLKGPCMAIDARWMGIEPMKSHELLAPSDAPMAAVKITPMAAIARSAMMAKAELFCWREPSWSPLASASNLARKIERDGDSPPASKSFVNMKMRDDIFIFWLALLFEMERRVESILGVSVWTFTDYSIWKLLFLGLCVWGLLALRLCGSWRFSYFVPCGVSVACREVGEWSVVMVLTILRRSNAVLRLAVSDYRHEE